MQIPTLALSTKLRSRWVMTLCFAFTFVAFFHVNTEASAQSASEFCSGVRTVSEQRTFNLERNQYYELPLMTFFDSRSVLSAESDPRLPNGLGLKFDSPSNNQQLGIRGRSELRQDWIRYVITVRRGVVARGQPGTLDPGRFAASQQQPGTSTEATTDNCIVVQIITEIRIFEPTPLSFKDESIPNLIFIQNRFKQVELPAAVGGKWPLKYSIIPPPGEKLPKGLELKGSVLSGSPTEASKTKKYAYEVIDRDLNTRTLNFNITVNPFKPLSFGNRSILNLDYTRNVRVPTSILPVAVGGQAPLTYSNPFKSLPKGLEYDPNTRQIRGTPEEEWKESYKFEVTDALGDKAELTVNINVMNATQLRFVDNRIKDMKYVFTQKVDIRPVRLPHAVGGHGRYTYKFENHPKGLRFDPNSHELRGAPEEISEGLYNFTVTDEIGNNAELVLNIVVKKGVPLSFGNQTSLILRYDGKVRIRRTLPVATGGQAPLTYSFENRPKGLEFNQETRELSGTPEDFSTGTYKYKVTDASGDEAELDVTITVRESSAALKAGEDATIGMTSTIAASAADMLRTRLSAGSSTGNSVKVMGQWIQFGPSSSAFSRKERPYFDRKERPYFDEHFGTGSGYSRGTSLEEVLRTTAFEFSFNTKDDGTQDSSMLSKLTFWGQGASELFEDRQQGGSSYEGELRAGYLGVESQRDDQWLFGLATALANAQADYALGDGVAGDGRLEANVTSFLPYFRYTPDAGNVFWSLLGFGSGEIENERIGGAGRSTSNLSMYMGAAGARRSLEKIDTLDLDVFGDVGFAVVEIAKGTEESEVISKIDGFNVNTWRGRLGIKMSRKASLEGGAKVVALVEVAGRIDGGDNDEEAGLEVSPGLSIFGTGGHGIEARGRFLALHTKENYEEYGGSLTYTFSPQAGNRGLSLSISTRAGAWTQNADTLWGGNAFKLSDTRSTGRDPLSLEAAVGYGTRALSGVLTPFGEFSISGESRRRLRAGARFSLSDSYLGDLRLEFVGERHVSEGSAPRHRVGVTGSLGF